MNRVQIEESTMAPGLKIIKRASLATNKVKKKKVAAYCRVSTDKEEQESSLDNQMESYKKMIGEHPDWELAGIYADRGTTGTSVLHRKDFLRMIDDAQAGKIDVILAKSTSRFARNTLDTLEYTRMLKALGIVVYFEKEAINTGELTSEMLLTIYAAFSQEESLSISRNLKTGIRNRFKLGQPKRSAVHGYNVSDEWSINEDEAEIVRRIFNEVLWGYSTGEIAQRLNDDGIPTFRKDGDKWEGATIGVIIANEKHMGNVLMQKYLIQDHLSHRHIKNDGSEVEQYLLENHHEAIVDEETFQLANETLRRRNTQKGASQYPYYGYMTCPFCGKPMVAVKTSTKGNSRYWVCSERCKDYALHEAAINTAMLAAVGQMQKVPAKEKALETGRISYALLAKYVKGITFRNFTTMEVTFKNKGTVSVPVAFGSSSIYMAYAPVLEAKQVDDVWHINGAEANKQNLMAYISRKAAFDSMKVELMESHPYPQVTTVFPKKVSEKAKEMMGIMEQTENEDQKNRSKKRK